MKLRLLSYLFSEDLRSASYRVDLEKVTKQQFNPITENKNDLAIFTTDLDFIEWPNNTERLTWGIGPYVAHRLFNPIYP